MYPGWSARDNYAIHKKRRKRKVKQVDSKGEEGVEDSNKESECMAAMELRVEVEVCTLQC